MRRAGVLFVVVSMLTLSGCWFSRQPKAQAPPPAPPPSQVPRTTQTPRSPTSAKTAPAKRKPTASAPRAAPPAANHPPRAAEVKKPVPTPKAEEPQQQLGQILSDDEKTQYRTTYERSSTAAREMLKTLTGRQLATDKLESIGRIRSFLAQAKEAAASDWSAAAQLAYRAEILARDLVRTLE
jgi:hypothetical protein